MTMNVEEWVQTSREEKRQLFGEIGLHDDCVHCGKLGGKPFCNVCINYTHKHRHNKSTYLLQCEKEVCYFYEPKED